MYDLMFIARAPMHYLDKMNHEDWSEGNRAFGFLTSTVQDCIDHGHFAGQSAESLSFLIWSCVHGMVALEIRDRCKGLCTTDPKVVFDKAFESFIRILEIL
jgi:hypothetical protein